MSKTHTKGQFIDFCGTAFRGYSLDNNGHNLSILCPICVKRKGNHYKKRKLGIELNTHVMHCWVCGYKSKNLVHMLRTHKSDFLEEYLSNFKPQGYLSEAQVQEELNKIVRLPQDFQLLVTADTSDRLIMHARNYLKARGVGEISHMWYWRFGITKDVRELSRRIIIPSYDGYGTLNYYTARCFDSRIKRIPYKNPDVHRKDIIFNEINIDWCKPITIVEGVFDLMKCNENATCILGKELNQEYTLFQKIIEHNTPVVIGLDPDARRQAFRIAQLFYDYDISTKIIEYDGYKGDIGDMDESQFNEYLSSARVYNMDYKLRSRIASIQ